MQFSILAASLEGVSSVDQRVSSLLSRFVAEHNISCASIRRPCQSDSAPDERADIVSLVKQELGGLGLKYSCAGPNSSDAGSCGACVLLAQLPTLGTISKPIVAARLAISPDVSVDVYSLCAGEMAPDEVPRFIEESVFAFERQWEHDHRRRSPGRPFTHGGTPKPDTRMIAVSAHFVPPGNQDLDRAMVDGQFVAVPFEAELVDRIYLKPAIRPMGQRIVSIGGEQDEPVLQASLAVFEV